MTENEDIMMISNRGTLVRTPVSGVSMVGRNTQGVTLIRTAEEELVVGLQRIEEIEESPYEDAEDGEDNANVEANAEAVSNDDQVSTDAADAPAVEGDDQ